MLTLLKEKTDSNSNQLNDREHHQSEVIDAIRFPLITLIVFFHLLPPEETYHSPFVSYNLISTFFSAHGISQLAVPAFFIISGYFFYHNIKEWNTTVYFYKIRKRIFTLLIPYLLWNGIPILGIMLVRLLMGIKSGTSLSLIREFGDGIGWLRAFWDCGAKSLPLPFVVPLWYVRDLMVCSVFSPVIYFLIRRIKLLYVLLLGFFFLTNTWIDVTGFSAKAWVFFSIGAYLSINRINMVCMFRKYAFISIPLSIGLLIITTYFKPFFEEAHPILNNCFLFAGVISLLGCFSYLVSIGLVHNIPRLTNSVFFIYAFHVFPCPIIISVTAFFKNLTGKLIVETQVITYFIQLIAAPTAIIVTCYSIYYLMHRFTPRLLSILIGQR